MEEAAMKAVLQTHRLLLRNLCSDDVGLLFAYRNDKQCNLYQRYDDTSIEYLRSLVQTYAHSCFPSREQEQHYAIVQRENGCMVGDLTVFFTEKDSCFTLGITIAPEYQKQGYAFELLKEVVAVLRKREPAMDIVALIEKENAGSIALFRKLNFVEECYADSIQSYVYVLYGAKD